MSRNNSFDGIRLLAALAVLWGHSYHLFGRMHEGPSWGGLEWHTGGVMVFFAMSGYLITQSWQRDPHVLRFFGRRALRILPALVVAVLLSFAVLGPVVTTLPASLYWRDSRSWAYLANAVLYFVSGLPGVFESSRWGLNGSLWTLYPEVLMYVTVAAVGLVAAKRAPWMLWPLVVATVTIWAFQQAYDAKQFWRLMALLKRIGIVTPEAFVGLASMFLFGALAQLHSIPFRVRWCAALIALAWATHGTVFYWIVLAVALPYITLTVATRSTPLAWLARYGDFSYGVYIYAFPIQQTVWYYAGGRPFWQLVALSGVATLVLAVSSWFLIERHFLRWKPKALSSSVPPVGDLAAAG